MRTCNLCGQKFKNTNQVHSCRDAVLKDFLEGKSEHTLALFEEFANTWKSVGKVTIHPTKSMIAFAARNRMAYVIRLGKNFIDIVFPFEQAYPDNLCFHKIAQVPGSQQFNHHLRIFNKEDLNEEVLRFMKLAYLKGK
jgi:hypothetical protein